MLTVPTFSCLPSKTSYMYEVFEVLPLRTLLLLCTLHSLAHFVFVQILYGVIWRDTDAMHVEAMLPVMKSKVSSPFRGIVMDMMLTGFLIPLVIVTSNTKIIEAFVRRKVNQTNGACLRGTERLEEMWVHAVAPRAVCFSMSALCVLVFPVAAALLLTDAEAMPVRHYASFKGCWGFLLAMMLLCCNAPFATEAAMMSNVRARQLRQAGLKPSAH